MEELPVIACTLTADELPRHLEAVEALARETAPAVEHGERSLTLRFPPGAETLERVRSYARVESACCAFLSIELDERPDATLLAIAAPPGGEPIVAELAARFDPAR